MEIEIGNIVSTEKYILKNIGEDPIKIEEQFIVIGMCGFKEVFSLFSVETGKLEALRRDKICFVAKGGEFLSKLAHHFSKLKNQ